MTCLEADDISDPYGRDTFEESMLKVIKALEHTLSTSALVLISWVFAKPELFTPLIKRFSAETEIFQIYLVASEVELSGRLAQRNDESLTAYSLEKLRLINSLPFEKINTTQKPDNQIAAEFYDIIQSSPNE